MQEDPIRLTRHTDYALRVLLHIAVAPTGKSSITEIAGTYGISRNHLMKVVHQLGRAGYIETQRGRGGGFVLSRPADQISLGHVVRATEPDFNLADCSACAIAPACGLTRILSEALQAMMSVLDNHTLADAAADPSGLQKIIHLLQAGAET